MKLREDQTRIKELLKDTITLLCKNGLQYKAGFSVEALIGITLDDEDVFLVNIKETIQTEDAKAAVEVTVQKRQNIVSEEDSEQEETTKHNVKNSRKRPPDSSPSPYGEASPNKMVKCEMDDGSNNSLLTSEHSKDFNIKMEPHDDDDDLVFVKQEGMSDLSSCSQGGSIVFPGQLQSPPHGGISNLFNQTTSGNSLPSMPSWSPSISQPSTIPANSGSQTVGLYFVF
jgi:hypothetical protein